MDRITMSDEQIAEAQANGCEQCIVEAQADGEICWDITDSREREPVHRVVKGDRFWCWNFKQVGDTYTHDYANMAPTDVVITTDVTLKLVYITDDCQDPVLFDSELDKSPNWT